MKRTIHLLPALMASIGLILAGPVTAQTITTLYNFTAKTGPFPATNCDGAFPAGGLILSGNTLYGTAYAGGTSGNGTVFKIKTDGTGFTNLHNFTATSGSLSYSNLDGAFPNLDGANPSARLILLANTLYATASVGGSSGQGTVFAVNTDGTGFTNLHSFTAISNSISSDGATPYAGLISSGNTLYGTASWGGNSGGGTVFALNTDGTGFTNLHSLTGDEGEDPHAGLILSDNTLYGSAVSGGSSRWGTVFALDINGTSFRTLHSFAGRSGPFPATNSDGAFPVADLILSGNTLYGTAAEAGSSGKGTVFAVNTDGTGFTILHSFTATSGPPYCTNNDGANPYAGLILSGSTLYGTAYYGGSSASGTVFALNTNGSGYTVLHSFTAFNSTNSDGAYPHARLILSGNTLYGTASAGGSSGQGTVFSLSLPLPQLTIIPSGANVILTWPADAAGFTLQSAPASTGTFTNLSGATSPHTNPISGAQQFFRLISN